MRVTIRTKLIGAILAPLLAVYGGMLVIHYEMGKRQAVHRAQRHLTDLAASHAARLDALFLAARQAAVSTAGAIVDQDRLPDNRWLDLVLTRNVRKVPYVYASTAAFEPNAFPGLTRRAGREVRHVLPTPRRLRPDRAPPGKTAPGAGAGKHPPAPPSPKRPAPPAPPPDPAPELPITRTDLLRAAPKFFEDGWYQAARARTAPFWTAPYDEAGAGGAAVTRCVVPLVHMTEQDADEHFIGAVTVDLFVAPLQRYAARAEVEGGYGILVDADGLIVAHPQRAIALHANLAALSEQHKLPALLDLAVAMRSGRSGVTQLVDFHTGLPSWVVHAPLRSCGWSFAAVIPAEQIMAPVYETLRRDMAVMLGGLGLIAAVVMAVSIRLTRPIERVAAVVRRLATGDLDARVAGPRSRDEIGELSAAFNRMVADLKRHVEALTRETAARKAVESELRVARQIQAALLPHVFPPFPHRTEFELHGTNVPAKEVAGDFFDYFFVDDETLALVIADVSGKGVPAALFMAVARTVLRNQAAGGAGPAEVLTRANRLLAAENSGEMFVTLFFAHYNTRTGRLVYANAGHNPPCVASGGGVAALNGSTGPVLGIFSGRRYEQREAQVAVGDSVVLYTDGVTEALDRQDRQFALRRLQEMLAANAASPPQQLCDMVVQAVQQHTGESPQDDVTLLVLRRTR